MSLRDMHIQKFQTAIDRELNGVEISSREDIARFAGIELDEWCPDMIGAVKDFINTVVERVRDCVADNYYWAIRAEVERRIWDGVIPSELIQDWVEFELS